MNPAYTHPRRTKLNTSLLNTIFLECYGNVVTLVKSLPYFTLAFDGWKDISGNSIYGLMVLYEDQEYLISLMDLSGVYKTASNLKCKIE
jgi:hypothetical protein